VAEVLVVLIVVATAQKTSHERATGRASAEVLLPGEFARADLGRLEIGWGREDGAVVLERGPQDWSVATAWHAPASGQRLDTLLRSLSNLRGEFRSASAAVLADYGFTDSTTVTIAAFAPDDREVFRLEIGGRPAGGMGNFVRRAGSDEVFLTSQNLLSNLGLWGGPERPQSRHFLELQALRIERQDVDEIRLSGEVSLRLAKEHVMIEPAPEDTVHTEAFADRSQWEWRLDTGERTVKTTADGVLNSATNVRAQDVADPGAGLAAYGLDDPARRAVLVHHDGTETRLAFGDRRDADGAAPGGYYALLGDSPTIWVVADFNVESIFKTRAELLPEG
jgi:hypothetical protein